MDKLDKAIANYLLKRFEEWKPHFTKEEQDVFVCTYIKRYSAVKTGFIVGYSDRQVRRILQSIRRKLNKLIP